MFPWRPQQAIVVLVLVLDPVCMSISLNISRPFTLRQFQIEHFEQSLVMSIDGVSDEFESIALYESMFYTNQSTSTRLPPPHGNRSKL